MPDLTAPPPARPRLALILGLAGALLALPQGGVRPGAAWAESRPPLTSAAGMVAADDATASAAGARILAAGGDAVDAAVTTALVLGVVAPFASGIGGGGFALVHRADGSPAYALDFREVAPAGATRDMYLDARGEVVPGASQDGPRAAAVPGELAGLYALHQRHGKLPWATVVAPAVALARDGFPVGALLFDRLAASKSALAAAPALRRDLCDAAGDPLPVGTRVRRPDLARTLAAVAEHGPDALYRGPVGQRLAAAMAADGGLVTAADLAAYQVKPRTPLRLEWRGFEVLSMPPPSSGGAVIGQALKVLEDEPLARPERAAPHNGSAWLHRLTETLKHGFADRARVMGDPDFVPVPVAELLADAAIARVRDAFKPDAVLPAETYGQPFALPDDGGTSHFNVIDAAGNAVALTTTVNTGFGSKYVAGDTGILLNNEMDDFIARPGVPNAFGLVGRAANAIAPGKRPLSSMSPTLVRRDGQVVLAVGGSGGPTIITGTLQVLLNVLHFGLDPQAAVDAPRLHHQWSPDALLVDAGMPEDVLQALERRGQKPKKWQRFTAVQVIERDPATGRLRGASDPTKRGAPARSEDFAPARGAADAREPAGARGPADAREPADARPARTPSLRGPTPRMGPKRPPVPPTAPRRVRK